MNQNWMATITTTCYWSCWFER